MRKTKVAIATTGGEAIIALVDLKCLGDGKDFLFAEGCPGNRDAYFNKRHVEKVIVVSEGEDEHIRENA